MKKSVKIASLATLAVAAGVVGTTALVHAWGDNSSDSGRRTYTLEEINKGVLGDNIVFNSIKYSDSEKADIKAKGLGNITDERNFVGARDASTGNNGAKNVWNGNEIEVEEGKTYVVRLYVHNNNPKGEKAVAKDVSVNFSLPTVVANEERVDGYINSSNANPSKYWDSVVFKSKDNRKFYLDYVEGSALLENNAIGKNGGIKLDDSVVTSGTKIGYDKLDGNVPGCYQYANYITIEVKPVFENTSIEKKVRKLTDKKFSEEVNATVGETVEYQIHYKNQNANPTDNVIVRDSLPTNMEYVKGSTRLYNTNHPKGATVNDDTIVTDGINIGNYNVNGSAYVRFKAVVKDNNLACGTNRLINWAKADALVGTSTNVKAFAVQDNADVYVEKTCKEETPEIIKCAEKDGKLYGKDGKVVDEATYKKECGKAETHSCEIVKGTYYGIKGNEVDYNTYKSECEKPESLPKTGASNIAAGAVGMGSVVTAAGYLIASRKQRR